MFEPAANKQQTASIDLELLNMILQELSNLAQVTVHLQSSPKDDPAWKYTSVSWSQAIANLLPAPFAGTSSYSMHVDNPTVEKDGHEFDFEILGLNAPSTLVFVSNTPDLVVQVTFDPQKGAIKALGALLPDIDVSSLVLSVHVGFDGSVRPQVQASAAFQDSPLPGLPDPSSDLQTDFQQQLNNRVSALISAQTVKQAVDSIFVRMMRLNSVSAPPQAAVTTYQANIQSYSIDDNGALLVTYSLAEVPITAASGTAPPPNLPTGNANAVTSTTASVKAE